MPVTINEVEINTTVTENAGQNQSGQSGKETGAPSLKEEADKIVEICMQRVRELLDELKER